MNGIALYLNGKVLYWNAVIIAMGVLCCLCLTIALYRQRQQSLRGVLLFFPLATLLGLLLGRLLYWYFTPEPFSLAVDRSTFAVAFSDFSLGSFALPGVILGIWVAAWIVCALDQCPNAGLLLDCTAPGLALLIAVIRLSALFSNTCRSRILVEANLLKVLPFAVANTNAAGDRVWRLAVFFLAFLAMLILTLILLRFYVRHGKRKMLPPCARSGNVWRMFLLYYAAVEIVVDSLRNDRLLMHFTLLSKLNQYSSFVCLAQIFAAATALYVLVYYSVMSIKARGFSYWHALSWLGFVLCLVCIGYLGEYKVQRYETYFRSYSIMILSCIAMVVIVRLVYRSCVVKKRRKYEW